MRLLFLLIFFLLHSFNLVFGQNDTVIVSKGRNKDQIQKDTASIPVKSLVHLGRDPRRASLLAAVLPGSGQLYNKKYWKIPIVFGLGYTLGYYIKLNHQEYILKRDEYLLVKNGNTNTTGYNTEQLVRLREYWRRNRDLLIILSSIAYLMNIADAAVDAHFSNFDVSDDLSLNWKPQFYLAGNKPGMGLGLTLAFK